MHPFLTDTQRDKRVQNCPRQKKWGESDGRAEAFAGETKENGQIPEWPNGADCKSAGLRLRWFESIFAHVEIAEVAQLIEHQPSKLRVASLSLVFRSRTQQRVMRMHSVPPGRKRLCRPLVLRNENEMNFKTLGQFLTIL